MSKNCINLRLKNVKKDFYIFTKNLSYELGGGAAEITSHIPVNDGKEHLIRVTRKGRNGTLTLDNYPSIYGTSSGILAMLNVEGNIYLGN